MRPYEIRGGNGATESWGCDGESANHNAILIGGNEVVLGEDKLIQEVVLIDCCLTIGNQDLEDISSYQGYYFRCGSNLVDGDLLTGQDLLLNDGPSTNSKFV